MTAEPEAVDARVEAIREWDATCTQADGRMAREVASARARRDETVAAATEAVNEFLATAEPGGVLITAAVRVRVDHEACWQKLKDYLAESIQADEAVRQGMVADGEDEMAAPFGGLVSANRSTLAKMRELEAGK